MIPPSMSLTLVLASTVFGLLAAAVLAATILKKPQGTEEMQRISRSIRLGAMTFLKTEYSVIAIFVAGILLLLFVNHQRAMAIAFLAGAVASGLAGWLGMATATRANVRTTQAAKSSVREALDIAFSSGMVMGLCVVSLGLAGVTGLYLWFGDPQPLFAFGFGASSIALFARVGGGIFTKAADVGADLVGKVEAGIPEDDPRNPAVIADNVGDNVGDVAGMGADLFESYVGSIIATMALGVALPASGGRDLVILPLFLAAFGIFGSVVGKFFVRTSQESKLQAALFRGLIVASLTFIALTYWMLDRFALDFVSKFGKQVSGIDLFWAVVIGLVLGVLIGKITEYYTSEQMRPARHIAAQSQTGSATNLIAGLAVGMGSTWAPVTLIAAAVCLSYQFAGLYGISVAAVGMLATLGSPSGWMPMARSWITPAALPRCPSAPRRSASAPMRWMR